jgi:hypothetical protein
MESASQSGSGEARLEIEAGRTYALYLELRMADELKVMDSITQRGISVITTAGALVTLLIAAGSIALGAGLDGDAALSDLTKGLAILGTIAFAISAAVALSVSVFPLPKDPPDSMAIQELTKPHADAHAAVTWVIKQRRSILKDWFPKNTTKAYRLAVALVFETVAVGCVALAVVAAVLGS